MSLPGFPMEHYDVSSDGQNILFIAPDARGHSPLWIAALDGSFPPRQLTQMNAIRALFGPGDDVYFVADQGSGELYLYRISTASGSLDSRWQTSQLPAFSCVRLC